MDDAEPQRIFVTGVNGHIGNHIVRDLLEHGYFVRGSVRDLNDASKTEHVLARRDLGLEDRLELVEGDVLEADGWEGMLQGCDGLFHTATIYSTRGTATMILDTANKGTAHLLHAAATAGQAHCLHVNLAAVGTSPRGQPRTKPFGTRTSLPYTTAKTQSERLAWKLADELNLDLRHQPHRRAGRRLRPTDTQRGFLPGCHRWQLPRGAKVPHVGGSCS